jgi:uncharacterized hydrophobic protein (TIGR00271 family)
MVKKVYFIVEGLRESDEFETLVSYIQTTHKIEPTMHTSNDIFEDVLEDSLFLVYLSDEEIKNFFTNHLEADMRMGIVPNETCPNTIKSYGISKDVFEAIDDTFNEELLSQVDVLTCNENIVFDSVVVGDMHGMNRWDFNEQNRFGKIKIFFNNLTKIKFQSYTLTTGKEEKITTVASGITVVEHNKASEKNNFGDDLPIHDGKLNAFVLAPTSLLSYLWYLISIFFYQRISLLTLPKSLGFIKTSKLTIESSSSIDYMLDANLLSAQSIELIVAQNSLNIHLGRKMLDEVKVGESPTDEKDIINVKAMPHGEISNILIEGKIPLFKKASEEDFHELFLNLRSNASFSSVFLILTLLSTLLATTGLFANSSPVIIGAMILAPLMGPIVSLAMGVTRGSGALLVNSIKTLAIGVSMALLFSCILTLILPLGQITPEMQARVNPNLLDLMVAIFSGIAGAYAYSKEEIAKSLAGVAIAVALVPPLSITGIGIGLGNVDVIYGSFLLFITNLIGITLSAALTFIVLGFAPVKRAKKGLFYTFVMMVLISIPLVISFKGMVEHNRILSKLETLHSLTLENERVDLVILNLENKSESVTINLEAVSTKPLAAKDYQSIKRSFQEKIDKKVILKILPEVIVE